MQRNNDIVTRVCNSMQRNNNKMHKIGIKNYAIFTKCKQIVKKGLQKVKRFINIVSDEGNKRSILN